MGQRVETAYYSHKALVEYTFFIFFIWAIKSIFIDFIIILFLSTITLTQGKEEPV